MAFASGHCVVLEEPIHEDVSGLPPNYFACLIQGLVGGPAQDRGAVDTLREDRGGEATALGAGLLQGGCCVIYPWICWWLGG